VLDVQRQRRLRMARERIAGRGEGGGVAEGGFVLVARVREDYSFR